MLRNLDAAAILHILQLQQLRAATEQRVLVAVPAGTVHTHVDELWLMIVIGSRLRRSGQMVLRCLDSAPGQHRARSVVHDGGQDLSRHGALVALAKPIDIIKRSQRGSASLRRTGHAFWRCLHDFGGQQCLFDTFWNMNSALEPSCADVMSR